MFVVVVSLSGIQCSDKTIFHRIVIIGSIMLVGWGIMRAMRPILKKYKSAWRDVLRLIKIQMDFWQVTSAMGSTMPGIQMPKDWLGFVAGFSFVNFDFSGIFGLQCIDGISFYTSFVMISCMPIVSISIGIMKYQYRKFKHLKELKKEKLENERLDKIKKENKKKGIHTRQKSIKEAEEVTKMITGSELKKQKEKEKAIQDGLRIAFNIADKDNSGFIDVGEFATLVRNLGFHKFQDKHATKLFNSRSKDGDMFLDQEEFIELVLDPKNKVHIDTEVIAWSAQRRDMYHAFADVSQLLLIVHTPVARSFFTYFNCVNISGQRYLKQDMTLLCDGKWLVVDVVDVVWMYWLLRFVVVAICSGFDL